jgi:hypothetical protein
MTEEIKDEEIKVSEEKDGSATVEMPDNLIPDDEEGNEETQKAEGGSADDEDDEPHDPDESDRVREARRARRKAKKEYIKKTQQEKEERLSQLMRENQEIKARLAEMERQGQAMAMGRLEKAIQDEESRMNYAKVRMKEAADNSDGQALVRAQELYMEAKDKLAHLQASRVQAERAAQSQSNEPNPVIAKHAERWMAANSWYDPEGNDSRSKLAKQIDNQLTREGWNPATRDYWEELSTRLQELETDDYTESNYEAPRKRGPRSVVTGSERETGGGSSRGTFTLTPEQVRAMKEAGLWDDPKKRAKMAAKYAEQARQTRR